MKIELLASLKGSKLWGKGTVFDSTVAPIPGDILKEAAKGSAFVKVTATEKPITVAVETENEIADNAAPHVAPELSPYVELLKLQKQYSSKSKLAKAVGTSITSINRWLSGKHTPSDEMGAKIHELFLQVTK